VTDFAIFIFGLVVTAIAGASVLVLLLVGATDDSPESTRQRPI